MEPSDYKRMFERKFNLTAGSINSIDFSTQLLACTANEKHHDKMVLGKSTRQSVAMRNAYLRMCDWYAEAPYLPLAKKPLDWQIVQILINAAPGYGYCVSLAMKNKLEKAKAVDDAEEALYQSQQVQQ